VVRNKRLETFSPFICIKWKLCKEAEGGGEEREDEGVE
jgi:hypothetical protein